MGGALRRLGVKGIEVRKSEQLEKVPSLIFPVWESTTVAKLAHYHNLVLFSPVAKLRSMSFSARIASKEGGPETFRGVHAPAVLEAGPEVEVLAEKVDAAVRK